MKLIITNPGASHYCSTVSTVEFETLENKEIKFADKVLVTDGSYNFDELTKEKRAGINPLFKNPCIVLQVGCEKYVSYSLSNDLRIVKCDLLLQFENGTRIYCNPRLVVKAA